MSADLKINITADAQQATAAFKSTATAAKDMGSALGDAREKVETVRAKLELLNKTALQGAPGKALAKDYALATAELKTLETQAGLSGTATTGAFNKVFGAVRQLAYVLPGIGIAGILGLVSEQVFSLAKELFNAATAAQFAAAQQKELNIEIGKAQASTAGEIANIKSLVSIAGNESLSRDARTEALKKLNKEYPAYFKNANLDGTTSEKLKKVTDDLTNSILLNAKAKAIQGEIDKSAARVSAAQNDENTTLLTTLDKLKIALRAQFGGIGQSQLLGANLATKEYNELVKKETDLQASLSKQLTDTNTKLAVQGTLFGDKIPKTKIGKEKEDKILLRAEIRLPENEADLIARDLKKIELDKIFAKQLKDVPVITFSIETQKAIEALASLRAALERTKAAGDTFVKQFNAAFNNLAVDGLSQIGETIGAALSGSTDAVQAALRGFTSLMGDFIQTIGKALIQYGITKAGLDKVLKLGPAFPGVLAIGLGVAAVALGALVKNSFKQRAFAEGGIVTGPTNALIGEAGPEVVFPLAKLKSFLGGMVGGGGNTNISLSGGFRLQGGDLLLAVQQAEQRRGRGVR